MRKKISKNFYRGALIRNPLDIMKLGLEKKSIYHKVWGIKSAAFYQNLQLRIVIQLIESKSIYKIKRIGEKNELRRTN